MKKLFFVLSLVGVLGSGLYAASAEPAPEGATMGETNMMEGTNMGETNMMDESKMMQENKTDEEVNASKPAEEMKEEAK